jgi:hypothetical protein
MPPEPHILCKGLGRSGLDAAAPITSFLWIVIPSTGCSIEVPILIIDHLKGFKKNGSMRESFK